MELEVFTSHGSRTTFTSKLEKREFRFVNGEHECHLALNDILIMPQKLRPYTGYSVQENTILGYHFWCPGCKRVHGFRIRRYEADESPQPLWTFDGDLNKPTFSPSLLYQTVTPRCHLFLTGGQLHFLTDCGHELAGKVVDLPDWPERLY